jgi:hypothetical protein
MHAAGARVRLQPKGSRKDAKAQRSKEKTREGIELQSSGRRVLVLLPFSFFASLRLGVFA